MRDTPERNAARADLGDRRLRQGQDEVILRIDGDRRALQVGRCTQTERWEGRLWVLSLVVEEAEPDREAHCRAGTARHDGKRGQDGSL